MNRERLLDVQGLTVSTVEGLAIVKNVSFHVDRGEFVGIVGQSGSGKTLTSLAVAKLLPRGLDSVADRLVFAGHDLVAESDRDLGPVLGTELAMVFQDPLASLNPARRIGNQMVESIRAHRGISRAEARTIASASLASVGIDQPDKRLKQYPYELSGGMRQRVMIAMGLMTEPSLFIADEPTTALDVTVQAQVVQLLVDLNQRSGTAVLMVSHNISLLSEMCDRVIVMYEGRIVEQLAAEDLATNARHPYTQALLRAVPDLSTDRDQELLAIPADLSSAPIEEDVHA